MPEEERRDNEPGGPHGALREVLPRKVAAVVFILGVVAFALGPAIIGEMFDRDDDKASTTLHIADIQTKALFTIAFAPGVVSEVKGIRFAGGSLPVEGTCTPGDEMYFVTVSIVRLADKERKEKYWLQGGDRCAQDGKWSFKAWGCYDGSDYAVLVVKPVSQVARDAYSAWGKETNVSRDLLPYTEMVTEAEVLGRSPEVQVHFELGSPPRNSCGLL